MYVVEELLIVGGFQGKDRQVNHSPMDGPIPVSIRAAESRIHGLLKKDIKFGKGGVDLGVIVRSRGEQNQNTWYALNSFLKKYYLKNAT